MKRFFSIVSLLALVLACGVSCDKNYGPSYKYPILFNCSDLTRAVADLDGIKSDGFEVYAYFSTNDVASGTFVKDVAYDSDNNYWWYDGIEYWLPGATYHFKAFYPKDIPNLEVDNTTSAQSYTIADYDVTQQLDLLVAEKGGLLVDSEEGAPTTGSVVELNFQHQLALVVIAAQSKINGVVVESIFIESIAQTGECKNGSWTYSQTTTVNKTPEITLSSSDEDFKDVSEGGFLLIPQVINGSTQKLIIETSNKDYDIAIPAITWEKGKKYTYTLTIEQNDILFDEPTIVEEWDETNATGSVIIK